jgi:hypothetical protein
MKVQELNIEFLHLTMKTQLQETISIKWLWSQLLHNFVIVLLNCNFRFGNGTYGLLLYYYCNECDDDVIVTFDDDENKKMCDVTSQI